MLTIPHSEALKKVAQRLVWFKKPDEALDDPYLFMAHVMTYGTIPDVLAVKQALGMEAFREGLEYAPPDIIDPKSWSYWHLRTETHPAPPLPTRTGLFDA